MHDRTLHPAPADPRVAGMDQRTGLGPREQPAGGDLRLVERARAGDERAFAELVDRYGGGVISLCYASTLDAAEAEDLAQEVFVAAWRGLARFRGDAAFSTWLFALARNACIDQARRRSGRPPLTEAREPRGGGSRRRTRSTRRRARRRGRSSRQPPSCRCRCARRSCFATCRVSPTRR